MIRWGITRVLEVAEDASVDHESTAKANKKMRGKVYAVCSMADAVRRES